MAHIGIPDTLKGRSGPEVAQLREAMMQMREAEILERGRDFTQARDKIKRAIDMLPKDSPLFKRAKKIQERIEGKN